MRSTLKTLLFVAVVAAVVVGLGGDSQGGKQPAAFEPGGDWLDNMRTRIKDEIDDAATASALVAEVDKIQAELESLDTAVKAYYEKLDKLNRDYKTRRADHEAVIMEFNTTRMATRDRIFDIRFRMRNLCMPDQWKIVTDIDKSLLLESQREFGL